MQVQLQLWKKTLGMVTITGITTATRVFVPVVLVMVMTMVKVKVSKVLDNKGMSMIVGYLKGNNI